MIFVLRSCEEIGEKSWRNLVHMLAISLIHWEDIGENLWRNLGGIWEKLGRHWGDKLHNLHNWHNWGQESCITGITEAEKLHN